MGRLGVALGVVTSGLGEGGGVWAGFSETAGNGVTRRLIGEGVDAESLGLDSGEFGERGPRRRGPMGDCGGLAEERENLGFVSVEDIDIAYTRRSTWFNFKLDSKLDPRSSVRNKSNKLSIFADPIAVLSAGTYPHSRLNPGSCNGMQLVMGFDMSL
jgi:hypothetical protein